MISALAFGSHIVFEQVHLRSSPRITAFHVSSAAGIGAFGLAVAANIHAQAAPPVQRSLLLALSLGIWPIMTALPAFFVALGACPRNSARGTRKPNSCGSTNSSRNAGTKLAGEQNRHRNSAAAILNEKHSPMPLSGVAWSRGAVKCYVSDTPVPTPLLFCPFRVARIGETRGLA